MIYCLILIAAFSAISYLYSYYAAEKNFLNNAISYAALSFVFTILFLILFVIRNEYFYINFIVFFFTLLVTLFLVVFITSIIVFIINIIRRNFDKIQLKIKKPSSIKLDLCRKLFHIIIFFALIFIFFISTNYQNIYRLFPSNKIIFIFANWLTGYKGQYNNYYLIEEVGFYYYVILYFFLILTFVILTNEFTRKTRYIYFPLNFIPNFLFHEDENNKYGSYVYFAIGHLFAALIIPPSVLFGILAISVFGDATSSQIGLRFGKVKYPWNNKTLLGSSTGFFVSLVISSLFVNSGYALFFGLIYYVIDLITKKPVNISDNLAVPIICAILYNLIIVFEVIF